MKFKSWSAKKNFSLAELVHYLFMLNCRALGELFRYNLNELNLLKSQTMLITEQQEKLFFCIKNMQERNWKLKALMMM